MRKVTDGRAFRTGRSKGKGAASGDWDSGDSGGEEGRRAHFAKALARAEFGRFFWDDRLEAGLRAAMAKPKPKPRNGKGK